MHKEFFMRICAQVALLLALKSNWRRWRASSVIFFIRQLPVSLQGSSMNVTFKLNNRCFFRTSHQVSSMNGWVNESTLFRPIDVGVSSHVESVFAMCAHIMCLTGELSSCWHSFSGDSRQTNCSFNDFHDNVEKNLLRRWETRQTRAWSSYQPQWTRHVHCVLSRRETFWCFAFSALPLLECHVGSSGSNSHLLVSPHQIAS